MTNLTPYEHDIFLSHNQTDEEWTAKLAERLENEDWQGRKLRVFFSPWDIRPGQSIPLEIERGLAGSRKVGLIMSPEAMASAWVELERLVTTYIAVSARQERLIPIYRRTCKKPALLQHILSVDFRDDSKFEGSYRKLLAAIKDEPPPRVARTQPVNPNPQAAAIPRPPVVGFVARQDAEGNDILRQLKEELTPEKDRFVALWGKGGVGKTALATIAARDLTDTFAQRIVWASAEKRADFTLTTLFDEIATQLGHEEVRQLAPEPKQRQVEMLIAEAATLIVLDNFETITPEEQARCAEWLAERAPCPALVTTRERIDSARNISISEMLLVEAREFLGRFIRQETHNTRAFTGLDRDYIIEAVEANPLVMQWVVGQIDLAQEPRTVLEYLAHGEGKAAERVFDRSFNLPQLGDDGRAVLLALSMFVPSASRSALTKVAGFGNNWKRLDNALKRLAALRLIGTTEGGQRLTLSGLTRELAAARLSRDTRADDFRQRFLSHFLQYSKAHAHPTPEDYDALELEKDNLLSAMDIAFDSGDWERVQGIAHTLIKPASGMLSVRGYWDEAIKRGEQALAAAREAKDESSIAAFAGNIASLRALRGEFDKARQAHQQALIAFRELGNDINVAVALHQLAMIAQDQGEIEEAQRLYNESLEISRRLGDQQSIAATLHELAVLAQDQGEIKEARRLYDESLEISRRLGDQHSVASTLHELARLVQTQGEIKEARRLYDESLKIKRRLGDQHGIAGTLHQLGRLAAMGGNQTEAAQLMREALDILEKLESPDAEIARRSLERVEGNLPEADT